MLNSISLRRIFWVVFFVLWAQSAFAQDDTVWVRRYNGTGNSDDGANALTSDTAGNIYVTGYSVGIETYYDYCIIKYHPNGDTAWVRSYNGPGNYIDYANAIAVDVSGNVYVTGSSWGGAGIVPSMIMPQ